MKKVILAWIVPLVVAVLLVVTAKSTFFIIHVNSDDCMMQSFAKGQKLVFVKSFRNKRNTVVLVADTNIEKQCIKRLVGLPGDTLMLRKSIVYVNGQKHKEVKGLLQQYAFTTDSIQSVTSELSERENVDISKFYIGSFHGKFTHSDMKKLQEKYAIKNIARNYCPNSTSFSRNNIWDTLYWNKDNLGPLVIPQKGWQVTLDEQTIPAYHSIIEKESGKQLQKNGAIVLLGEQAVTSYTFKRDYYFLMNDNRTISSDSRNYGLVDKEDIKGTFFFRFPW